MTKRPYTPKGWPTMTLARWWATLWRVRPDMRPGGLNRAVSEARMKSCKKSVANVVRPRGKR